MDELILLFNQHRVRYLLIGGQEVRLEGMPRFSMDWDFYIPPRDLENIQKDAFDIAFLEQKKEIGHS
jgi:hypothetical protein